MIFVVSGEGHLVEVGRYVGDPDFTIYSSSFFISMTQVYIK